MSSPGVTHHLRSLPNGACARRECRAFSLIELLIVIAIILFLSTLYFKSGTPGSASQSAACRKNLEYLYVAQRTYAADHNDAFPAATNAATSEIPLSLLVPRYTSVTEIFICPGSPDKKLPEAKPFHNRKISYAYWMGRTLKDGGDLPLMSDAQVNTLPKSAGQPIFSSDGKRPGNNHRRNGGNVLFCDGRIESFATNTPVALGPSPGVLLLNPKSGL